jgi:hypothetical protein
MLSESGLVALYEQAVDDALAGQQQQHVARGAALVAIAAALQPLAKDVLAGRDVGPFEERLGVVVETAGGGLDQQGYARRRGLAAVAGGGEEAVGRIAFAGDAVGGPGRGVAHGGGGAPIEPGEEDLAFAAPARGEEGEARQDDEDGPAAIRAGNWALPW